MSSDKTLYISDLDGTLLNSNSEVSDFTFADTHDALTSLYEDVNSIAGISSAFYHEVSTDDSWLLEIFSAEASKSNALLRLKKLFGFDRIVGFGDNFNDLPLFEVCDECYAVENAVNDVKSAATAVVGANTDDGVAKWLEENVL